MQGVIAILCIQYLTEPEDLAKMNILNMLNNLKVRELQNRVDKCIKKLNN